MTLKEQIIRSEMQSLRTVGFSLCKAGITLCVAVEIALVFIRRSSYERLVAANQLPANGYVPWGRFLLGTLFLALIATIFSGLVMFVRKRYRFYSDLASTGDEDQLPKPPLLKGAFWPIVIFFAFPVSDFLLRVFFSTFAGLQ